MVDGYARTVFIREWLPHNPLSFDHTPPVIYKTKLIEVAHLFTNYLQCNYVFILQTLYLEAKHWCWPLVIHSCRSEAFALTSWQVMFIIGRYLMLVMAETLRGPGPQPERHETRSTTHPWVQAQVSKCKQQIFGLQQQSNTRTNCIGPCSLIMLDCVLFKILTSEADSKYLLP